MALILSTTSLGVVLPVLKERGMTMGRFGQSVLISALIADFATMLLITVDVAILSQGLTLDILLIGALFVVFFLVYRFGNFFFNKLPVVRRALEDLSHATVQIKVRAAFTMMFVFVVLSEMLGTELILGAFLAGVMVALLRTPADNDLVHQLEIIGYGFFIPIFFIMVGVDFNIAALYETPQALLLVPVLLVIAIAVKFIPAFLFRLNFSWRETFAAGVLLSARLSLIIAAAEIGLGLGIITEAVDMAIILVAMITVTAAPTIYVRLMPEKQEEELRSILVVGAEDFGLQVAEQLRAHHEQVIVMDDDEERLGRARRHGFEAVYALLDCDDPQAAPYLERTQILVCTYADVEQCYRVCDCAIANYGVERVVSLVTEPSAQERFQRLGVITLTVSRDRAALLALLARNPDVYELLTRTDDTKEVAEVVMRDRHHGGAVLRDLSLPGDVVVLTLHRDGEFFVPHADTRLNDGDRLTLIGSLEDIDIARQMLAFVSVERFT
jgi:Trk K+ transport system NAD-binding subunit